MGTESEIMAAKGKGEDYKHTYETLGQVAERTGAMPPPLPPLDESELAGELLRMAKMSTRHLLFLPTREQVCVPAVEMKKRPTLLRGGVSGFIRNSSARSAQSINNMPCWASDDDRISK